MTAHLAYQRHHWSVLLEEVERTICRIRAGPRGGAGTSDLTDDLGRVLLELISGAAFPDTLRASRPCVAAEGLVIGPALLHSFLLSKAAECQEVSRSLRVPCGPGGIAVLEKAQLIHALSLLGNALGSPDSSDAQGCGEGVPEAVLAVLVEMAQRDLGLDAALDIPQELAAFGRVEPALYLWRNSYRDHLTHVGHVCLMGRLLLDCEVADSGDALVHSASELLGLSREDTLLNWFLASLMHDVGYGFESVRHAVEHVDYLCTPFLADFRADVLGAMQRASEAVSRGLPAEVRGALEVGLDHGVISALHVQHLLDEYIEDGERRRMLQPACEAILMHNLHVPVSWEKNPIAALLILCDELQEWERLRSPLARLEGKGTSVRTCDRVETSSAREPFDSLEVRGATIGDRAISLPQDTLEFRLAYGPVGHPRYIPQKSCVQKAHNLQRLRLEGFPCRLRITTVHEFLESSDAPKYGFEALQSYAHEHARAGLSDFVAGRRGNSQTQVVKVWREASCLENISYDVQVLNQHPLLPKRLRIDWASFSDWLGSRQRGGQRG